MKIHYKQSAQKNKFWVHYVQTNSTENIPGRAKSSAPVAQILGAENNVSQSADKVKRQSRSDADYLSAVKRGDMKTAQRMVDEAAKAAGYNIKAYHGTPSFGFTKFKTTVFLTNKPEVSQGYGGGKGYAGLLESTE